MDVAADIPRREQDRHDGQPPRRASGIDAFLAVGVAGLAGCLLGGWAADRVGRAATAAGALAISGACCLLSPLSFGAGRPWLLAFTAVWGAAVIADSGVFSTLLSETADRRYIGTALTTQTAIGFLLTIVTIQIIPLIAAVRLAIRLPDARRRTDGRAARHDRPQPPDQTERRAIYPTERQHHDLMLAQRPARRRDTAELPARSPRTTSSGSPRSAETATPCTTTLRRLSASGSARSSSRAG